MTYTTTRMSLGNAVSIVAVAASFLMTSAEVQASSSSQSDGTKVDLLTVNQTSPSEGGGQQEGSSDRPQADNLSDDGSILVTAQRRQQRLSDVPLSISAVTTESIEAASISNAFELTTIVPGLQVTKSIGTMTPYIRGIGTQSPYFGAEPAVATYVDSVYQPSATGNVFGFSDLESIEVLKGPQGTLYGRNATGGVLNIKTLDPKFDLGAKLFAGYSNYDQITMKGYVTGGIVPSVAANLSVYYQHQRDGFGRNLTLREDIHKEEEFSIRGKILVDLGPDTSLVIAGNYMDLKNDKGIAGTPIRDGDDGAYTTVDFYDSLAGIRPFTNVKGYGVSARLEHSFGDVQLKFISAYQNVKMDQFFVNFNDAAAEITIRMKTTDTAWSNELQIGSTTGPVTWIAGAYHLRYENAGPSPTAFAVSFLTPFGRMQPLNIGSNNVMTSLAGYADATLAITDNTNFSAGARYTNDQRDITWFNNPRTVLVTVGGPPRIVPVPGGPIGSRETSKGKFNYRLVLDHRFNSQVMVYASHSTGFKSGYFSGQLPLSDPLLPEEVKAYELGIKLDLFDRTLRASAAVFKNDYTNMQVSRIEGVSTLVFTNAAAAEIKGVEAELTWNPSPPFTLTAGAQYLDGRFKEYKNVPAYAPIPGGTRNINIPPIDASGKRIRMAPEYTFNASASYSVPLGSGKLLFSGSLYYNDGYFFYADNRLRQESFVLLNGRVSWTSENGGFRASLYGTNLTQKKYYPACRCGETGGDNGTYGEPRRYGVEFEWKL